MHHWRSPDFWESCTFILRNLKWYWETNNEGGGTNGVPDFIFRYVHTISIHTTPDTDYIYPILIIYDHLKEIIKRQSSKVKITSKKMWKCHRKFFIPWFFPIQRTETRPLLSFDRLISAALKRSVSLTSGPKNGSSWSNVYSVNLWKIIKIIHWK